MLVMLAFIKHPQKTHRNSNLGDPTHATASAEQDLGNTEILHGQLTAQYLFPHYLGLVRMATIILVQFEEDAEIAEGAHQTATKPTHGKLFMKQVWELDFVSDWWRLGGDTIALIPEHRLQNVQPCGNVTKALKSSSLK